MGDPARVAERLTDEQRIALPHIWPATKNVALNWPRWVARETIEELAALGLVSETDLTDLGKAVASHLRKQANTEG